MSLERAIRLLAGSLVLSSLILSHLFGSGWLFLAAFVGANLVQSSLSRFCPAESILRRLGLGVSSVNRPGCDAMASR
jgi:hypothetical protein